MSDIKLIDIVESIDNRVALLATENIALQAILMSIISTMPSDKSKAVKEHLEAVNSAFEKLGIDESPEIVEARRALYERVFSGLS